MTIKPVIHHDDDGDECIAWGWRKRYFSNASAILKTSQGYYKLDDADGGQGGWLAWRAPLEQDAENGALVFPQGTQPLTAKEAEKAEKAYERRNWALCREPLAKSN